MMNIPFQVTSFSPQQFDALENHWRLLEKGIDMTIFQSYDWFKNINALYFRERTKNFFRRWEYLLVEKQGEPVMIAPIQIILIGWHLKGVGLRRGFYYIGRQGYTDYLNCIYSVFNPDAFQAVTDYLCKKYRCRFFCFEQLLESTALAAYIRSSFQCGERACYCAEIVLPDTFDQYKSLLSKSTRQNIRTAINRQNKNQVCLSHELVFSVDDTIATQLMAIRAIRLNEKRKRGLSRVSFLGRVYWRSHDILHRFFDAKHDVIHESCHPWCFLVKDGERIASFFWGVQDQENRIYYVILAGVDPEYAWYSPSISHLFLLFEEQYKSKNRQFDVLDFTRGGERYKEDLGGKRKNAMILSFICTTAK